MSFPLWVIDLQSLLLKSSAVEGGGSSGVSKVVPKEEDADDAAMGLGLAESARARSSRQLTSCQAQ